MLLHWNNNPDITTQKTVQCMLGAYITVHEKLTPLYHKNGEG